MDDLYQRCPQTETDHLSGSRWRQVWEIVAAYSGQELVLADDVDEDMLV